MPPREHARHFKEMLYIAKQLPLGEQHPPTEKLAVHWYYMTYHKSDHTKYVKSGKNLDDKTLKSLMNYFQALFAQKKAKPSSITSAIMQNSVLQVISENSARANA